MGQILKIKLVIPLTVKYRLVSLNISDWKKFVSLDEQFRFEVSLVAKKGCQQVNVDRRESTQTSIIV